MPNLEVPFSMPKGPSCIPSVNTIKVIFHGLQILATVLTICVVAPVIATEVRFYGASQGGPNYTLAVGLMSLAVPTALIVFPTIYDRQGKFRRLGKFCLKPRTNLIFCGFYTVLWITCGIAITVHANNPDNCNLFDDKQEDFGDDYRNAWPTQCNCAKVAAGFAWATCILWFCSLVCTLIIFWREKHLIQKNLRQHEMNKQAVLQMQQQQESDDEMYGDTGRHGGYRASGYYEDVEGEDLGGMRPQSFEQARPLQDPIPPPAATHQSPFDSPYDPPENKRMSYGYQQYEHPPQPYDPYPDAIQQHQPQPYDPYPVDQHQQPYNLHQSPFDDQYGRHSPEPPMNHTPPAPPMPQGSFTPAPMAMPDPTQYNHNPTQHQTPPPPPPIDHHHQQL
ncbi:hypothetical protein LRAMOSA00426 [Lichtheimia ramosa]|uniref:MARVEL domain-containing protein n=1 Tax=Lichtheimia ramosa TaxID=688394 RepID=A0A077W8Y9_9FUNG|nr:hypothetical protein LRAMOSA00426 [Lichtheimia ramosa]